MYTNDREEIAYHGFIKALRENQDACRELLADGVCSVSAVGRVELGDRLPEKLTRDRITSRLGISNEGVEEYLRIVEHGQWKQRMHILKCINNKDIEGAETAIAKYEETLDNDNRVPKQFVEAMRFMLYQLKGMHDDTLGWQLYLAIHYTVPSIEMALLGTQLLGEQELGLIIEYYHFCEYMDENPDEWRLERLQQVYQFIEESYLDMFAQAKLYPQISCYICDLILKKDSKQEQLEYAYDLCTQAIDKLLDAKRYYYFVELLEYRREIVNRMLKLDVEDVKRKELLETVEKDYVWEEHLKESYKTHHLPIYMENITHLFIEAEVYNVGNVMFKRRRMFKMSRKKAGEGSCTDKTIERAELHYTSPTIPVIRDVFNKLGMCPEYRRTKVITRDMDTLDLAVRVEYALDIEDYETAEDYLKKLEKELDLDILHNEQEVMRWTNLIALKTGEIDEKEFAENAMDAILCTLTEKALWKSEDKFFTKTELNILTDMALYAKGRNAKRAFKIIQKFCDVLVIEEMQTSQFCKYAALLFRMATAFEKYGDVEKADEMKQQIFRTCFMHRCFVELLA